MTRTAHKHRHHADHGAHPGRAAFLRKALRLRRLSWRFLHRKWIWRIFLGSVATMAVAAVAVAGLWWRLSNGPIEFDMATPWLKAAMEENFGGKHTVSVGGTQIETVCLPPKFSSMAASTRSAHGLGWRHANRA